MMKTVSTIDAYIGACPKEVRTTLEKLRATIRTAAPDATEAIKYGLATFVYHGNLVHFGAFKNHIGFYPAPSGIRAFAKELASYKVSTGAIQFPLDKPLPLSLIKKIVLFRVEENNPFLKLSGPAERALASAKISDLKTLSKWSEEKLLTLHGIGPSSLPPLRRALKVKKLTFKK